MTIVKLQIRTLFFKNQPPDNPFNPLLKTLDELNYTPPRDLAFIYQPPTTEAQEPSKPPKKEDDLPKCVLVQTQDSSNSSQDSDNI